MHNKIQFYPLILETFLEIGYVYLLVSQTSHKLINY